MRTFNYYLENGKFSDQSKNPVVFLNIQEIFDSIFKFISTNIDIENSWHNGQLHLRDNWFYKDGNHYLDIKLWPGEGEIEITESENGDTQDNIEVLVDIVINEYPEDIKVLQ